MKVFIIAAVTADGFIARNPGHLADWTGKEDKKIFVRLTKEAGVMVMGSRTFATIGRALPGRRTIVYTSNPRTITAEGVETTDETPAKLAQRLKNEGVKALAVCGGTTIYDLFIGAGLVDELYLTIVPVLFGRGVSLFSKEQDTRLSLLDSQQLNAGSVLLHYAVKRQT